MSTRVPYGFRVMGGLGAAYQAAFAFTPRALSAAREKALVYVVGEYVTETDRAALGLIPAPPEGGLGGVWDRFFSLYRQGRDSRNYDGPYHTLEVEFVLYPGPRGSALGRMCGAVDLYPEWLRMPGVVPFDYQNSSDRPEHVPAREWAGRKRAWSRVTDHYEERGLVYSCLGPRAPFCLLPEGPEAAAARVPTREERALARAREIVMDDRFSSEPPVLSTWEILAKMREYAESQAYREAVTARVPEILERLPEIKL